MEPLSVQLQAVLYHNDPETIRRTISCAESSVRWAQKRGSVSTANFRYGDSSPNQDLRTTIESLGSENLRVDYVHFGANLGSAGGHNQLAKGANADLIFLLNPDVHLSVMCLDLLVKALVEPGVGIVEARQMPIEHPKDYDLISGETSWTSGACSLIRRKLFEELSGYDAESFFLYCDDVDLAWRVRLAGYKAVFCPAASAFHGKKLGPSGEYLTSNAERHYSAEAAKIMATKYAQLDPKGKVADFDGGTYGPHRFEVTDVE